MEKTIFIRFDNIIFNAKGILPTSNSAKLKVLTDPKRKWYKVLFQYITFGLYKAPIQYKVKVVNHGHSTEPTQEAKSSDS